MTKEGWVLPEDEAGIQVSSVFCTIKRRFVRIHVGRLPLTYRFSERTTVLPAESALDYHTGRLDMQ